MALIKKYWGFGKTAKGVQKISKEIKENMFIELKEDDFFGL